MFFNDLEILRTIDRCEEHGPAAPLSSGMLLLQEVLHSPTAVLDEDTCKTFIRELELAKDARFLIFRLQQLGGQMAQMSIESYGANNYLTYIKDLHLTPTGRDRARCRVFEREPPDPGEDDGKPITRLTLQRFIEILNSAYDVVQLEPFLLDGGIPREMIPNLENGEAGLIELFSRFNGGDSNTRKIIRSFLGRWLDQELDSGPDADQERTLREDLARQGWFTHDGRLVRREPIRRATVAPLVGGDLLVNLDPTIQAAARPSFAVGRRAEAVFEAFKAIELRVRTLLASKRTGMTLMGDAFDGEQPALPLNALDTQAEIDEQRGFALIFKGAMLGVRNPKAHALFEDLEERRALDYLGFASLLMRRLDDVERRLPREIA